jgi:hypothetical protein
MMKSSDRRGAGKIITDPLRSATVIIRMAPGAGGGYGGRVGASKKVAPPIKKYRRRQVEVAS